MITKTIKVNNRLCDICHSDKQEKLFSHNFVARTKNFDWVFNVNVVICCDCGFVFTSPCATGSDLQKYYADSFAAIKDTNIDYDVHKRLNFIDKYSSKNNIFLEVGSNQKQTYLYQQLSQKFKQLMSVEIINEVEKDQKSLLNIASNTIGLVAHYFVLEHIPDIKVFLKECHRILINNGVMIVEVPDIHLYTKYTDSLLLHEHVNHFSTNKLKEIADQVGFELLETSQNMCSRTFGFVASFIKKTDKTTNRTRNILITNEYQQNKLLIQSCINLINFFQEKIKYFLMDCYSKGDSVIIWGANLTTKRIERNFIIPPNVTILDSNPEKNNYLISTNIFTPNNAISKIKCAKKIILILGECYHEEVLDLLRKDFKKEFLLTDIMRIGDF